jgi:hypothetical protein
VSEGEKAKDTVGKGGNVEMSTFVVAIKEEGRGLRQVTILSAYPIGTLTTAVIHADSRHGWGKKNFVRAR